MRRESEGNVQGMTKTKKQKRAKEARRERKRRGRWLEKVDGARTACPHRPMRQVVLTAMG